MEEKIMLNGTIADMKANDQIICDETKNDAMPFSGFLRGASCYLALAKKLAGEYDEKLEEKLTAYETALQTFGISCSYRMNDDETDLEEVRVSCARWYITLSSKSGMWSRTISEIVRHAYHESLEIVSSVDFARYDAEGNDTLAFTALEI